VKRLGLIGGVSPESTEIYCRLLNRHARTRLGGEHSANFIVWHLDYGVMIELYRAGAWALYADEIAKAGEGLKRAGAEALMICSNTSHLAADRLASVTELPVIHVVDALARAMTKAQVRTPLLLGTPVTMSGDYYLPALRRRFAGEPAVPTTAEQREVGRIILDELCLGVVADSSRRALIDIVRAHPEADAVILGCTELSLILCKDHIAAPVFDTTALHAAAGAAFAFGEEP
jgi:aspartate racemase